SLLMSWFMVLLLMAPCSLHGGVQTVGTDDFRLTQYVTAQRGLQFPPTERLRQVEARGIQGVNAKVVVVQQRIVPRRTRAVVTHVIARHVRVGREPAGVIVAALARTRGSFRIALAVRRDAVAARAFGNRAAGRRNID